MSFRFIRVDDPGLSRALADVADERSRQDAARDRGRFSATLADPISDTERLALVAREFGEVARATHLGVDRRPELTGITRAELRGELVQLAAVCVAWCEGIDREGALDTPVSTVVESPQLNERR